MHCGAGLRLALSCCTPADALEAPLAPAVPPRSKPRMMCSSSFFTSCWIALAYGCSKQHARTHTHTHFYAAAARQQGLKHDRRREAGPAHAGPSIMLPALRSDGRLVRPTHAVAGHGMGADLREPWHFMCMNGWICLLPGQADLHARWNCRTEPYLGERLAARLGAKATCTAQRQTTTACLVPQTTNHTL